LKTSEEMQIQLSEEEDKALAKAHTLLGFEAMGTGNPHHLTRKDLANAIFAATDAVPTEEQLDSLIQQFSADQKYLNFEEFKRLMTSGILYPEHKGRNWVAVSLAEAETIRRIIHIRQKLKDNKVQPLIENATTEIALRYSLMNGPTAPLSGDGGVILDSSLQWHQHGTAATVYEAAKAHNSFRFFDCDMHYAPSALNVLIRAVHGSVYDRERFFHATVGCRRRMERKWQETPLARLFMVPHQWLALKQSAQAIFFREALKAKNLTLWEAFTAFDYNNSGMLSPSEFYGALVWLGVPDLTPEDVADFIEAADKNRDGIVDYREYMDMLSDPSVTKDEDDEVVDEQDEDRVPIAKVEPYGADELREVMIHRKQAEINRQKDERLRRQAYKDALDVKVFEEELEASKRRKGGANPLVYTTDSFPGIEASAGGASTSLTVTDFKFSTNEFPLRLAPTGKCSFMTLPLHTSAYPPLRPLTCPSKHPLGACYYSWMNCALCKKRRTHYYCTRWCSYYVCTSCYDSDRKIREIEKRDPAKNPTFLRCSNSCSFTLQVPSAGGLNGATNGANFTVSLEVRFEKLPPKGHLQSLLRFSLPDIAQSRRLHRTSVYLNGDGVVVGRATGKGGLVEGGQAVKPGLWQIITVSVKPEEGEMTTYVNGKLCHVATGLDSSDLRLHHKLVILGGGRQAHSRGGDIRRAVIHSSYLNAEGCERIFFDLAQENPSIGTRILLVQSLYRGYVARKKLLEEGLTIKKLSAGPQFVAAPQDYY
jgi:Ca2+-binding EF-hand superfamily protein